MSKRVVCWVVLDLLLLTGGVHAEMTVSEAIEVAPKVKMSRSQMWPRLAWAEGSKSWLVAWREGDTNHFEADIYGARVSVDGKALDPDGIKICAAADNQERPWVASDGKGFLVVWEDFRNGKDYDVYAARVTADGKVLDSDGFLVAGGAHNQCHPVAVFADGNYYVVWQGYGRDGNRYLLYGKRISPDGKILDEDGILVTSLPPPDKRTPTSKWVWDELSSAYNPVIAVLKDRIIVAHLIAHGSPNGGFGIWAGVVTVNAKTGRPEDLPQVLGPAEQRMPALACSPEGGLVGAPSGGGGLVFYRLDENGKPTGSSKEVNPSEKIAGSSRGFSPIFTLAHDGRKYLLTLDRLVRDDKKIGQIKVWGLSLPASGPLFSTDTLKDTDVVINGALLSASSHPQQIQGFACAGPKGVCLVGYVEVRGADDSKVQARLVTTKQ